MRLPFGRRPQQSNVEFNDLIRLRVLGESSASTLRMEPMEQDSATHVVEPPSGPVLASATA